MKTRQKERINKFKLRSAIRSAGKRAEKCTQTTGPFLLTCLRRTLHFVLLIEFIWLSQKNISTSELDLLISS